jgi:proteasome accessory factor C
MTPVSTRLVRLLNMVPYFQANPRVTRAQAAADLGVSVKQLGEDLDQLWLCGLPGYSPGDLIDFGFEGDTIEVTFSAGMDTPLQLTSPEATGLLVALRALADIPGVVDPEAARSAIAKIEAAAGAAGHAHDVAAVDEPAAVESQAAAAVRAAVHDSRALSIDYYAASHDTLSTRIVDPIRIVLVGDQSYLEAWSRDAEGVRLFRFDRIVVAVRRRSVAAVGDVAAGTGGVVDVRVLPDAPAVRAARRLLRGGDDLRLRRVDGTSSAGSGVGRSGSGARVAGQPGARRRGRRVGVLPGCGAVRLVARLLR